MPASRTQAEKDLDARRNEAARLEVVRHNRGRSVTENLEAGLALHAQAVEFALAFAEARRQRQG